jgi:hypothetical protein
VNNEHFDLVTKAIDREHADKPAATRRQMIMGATATVGSLGLLGLPTAAFASKKANNGNNTPENILNIAATAEVLATIVNTVALEKLYFDRTTRRNLAAAAREELIHYQALTSPAFGGKPLTKTIWVPDEVFYGRRNLLGTLIVGDQIFVNAYMIGTTVFGDAGQGNLARITSEFMGAEAVHRALARQSLGQLSGQYEGLLGNDRVYMKYDQKEEAYGPGQGMPGFTDITVAVTQLQAAGFGFGVKGSKPGRFYDFDSVSRRTPNPREVNTRTPR